MGGRTEGVRRLKVTALYPNLDSKGDRGTFDFGSFSKWSAMDPFEISFQDRRVLARVRGDLEVEIAVAFRERVCDFIAESPVAVIIDFRELVDCGVFARSELISMQRTLRDYGLRTAYIADVARFRGLAMWIVNIAEDENAKACLNERLAEDWVVGTTARRHEIQQRTADAVRARKEVKQ